MPIVSRPSLERARRERFAEWAGAKRRLEDLGVQLFELDGARARKSLQRFATTFVRPELGTRILDELASVRDFCASCERWVDPQTVLRQTTKGCLAWLNGKRARPRIVRFDRSLDGPTIEIGAATIDESWLTSWPGVYADFESTRALFVTVHYETIRCDPRVFRRAAYR